MQKALPMLCLEADCKTVLAKSIDLAKLIGCGQTYFGISSLGHGYIEFVKNVFFFKFITVCMDSFKREQNYNIYYSKAKMLFFLTLE